MLVGIAFGREIGVDIEVINSLADLSRLCHALHADDASMILAQPRRSDQIAVFYQFWTSKESFAKKNSICHSKISSFVLLA
jgi:phosphopantetheinyl transferase